MAHEKDAFAFLAGGGKIEALMRARDWSRTPLGPIERWPQSLRTAVSIVLRSPTPIVMMWGAGGALIYNDAYAVFAGSRHPDIFGLPAAEAWPEIADHNSNMIAIGLSGQSTSLRDQSMSLNRNGASEELFLDLFYSPVPDDEGRPAGVMVIVVETTERVLAERRRSAEMQRMHRMFDQSPGFVAILGGPDHIFEFTNPAYKALIGHREVIGLPVAQAVPEAIEQGLIELMSEAFRTGVPYVGNSQQVFLRRSADGSEEMLKLDFIYQPIRDEVNQITHILVMGMDVTERVRAQEHQRFLLNELNHRVKNSLATVQSVVRQTIRQSSTLKEAGEAISSRILALSRAQDVLTGRSGAGTTVQAVVRSALEPHLGPGRFDISGPEVILGRRQALALSLAVHEMATNAVKYGALATDEGLVRILWAVDGNETPTFRFRWTESGGLPVSPPQRRGFGMDVIERGLGAEMDASVTMEYAPAGFVFILTADLASVKDG